ncbi:hypothetical protein GIB67_024667 [Kingdonia uniflora]|uniref:Uncharacterized protein n=1 Tax=Kingdonia uniflora TaxID=39325 RepID=A0A7J7LPH0_9MAGN|nr:hypothetical protein GIB67_024667 [Kingdonia uniflora]
MGNNRNMKGLAAQSHGQPQRAAGGSTNVKSILKMQHLQNLASWAAGEASMPSLGAFFGHRLASFGEAVGTPIDSSLVSCQRCESILQPGFNCTVRIENNGATVRRRRKKLSNPTQNTVIYTCHFCLHRNLKRGTQKGYVKDVYNSKNPKPVPESKPICSKNQNTANSGRTTKAIEEIPVAVSKPNIENSPATPAPLLLDRPKRKRKAPGSNKKAETTLDVVKKGSAASKNRRKSWSSLKDIVEKNKNQGDLIISNLAIPFPL